MVKQLSLFSGSQLKKLGQAQVLRNAGDQWREHALYQIVCLSERGEFTSDDLRREMDILIPSNENSWGAAFSAASKMKLIKNTGRYVISKIPSCQGRRIAVWQKY